MKGPSALNHPYSHCSGGECEGGVGGGIGSGLRRWGRQSSHLRLYDKLSSSISEDWPE